MNKAFTNTELSLRFALSRLVKRQDGDSLYEPKNEAERRQDLASDNLDDILAKLEENYPAILNRVKLLWEGKPVEPAGPEVALVSSSIYKSMQSEGIDFNAAFKNHVVRVTEGIAKSLVIRIKEKNNEASDQLTQKAPKAPDKPAPAFEPLIPAEQVFSAMGSATSESENSDKSAEHTDA